MVNWQEENKLTVTDIEDNENGIVYDNMTTPNNNFVSAKGTLQEKTREESQPNALLKL